MHKLNNAIDTLDMRSLRMLHVLLDTRSVTRAGEALAMGQPAASRVLAQLRKCLGDPLLVRGRHGNTLTPRAELLRPILTEALDALSLLFEKETFEPQSTQMSLRIAATDHGTAVVLTPLIKTLAVEAPGITVEVAPWSDQTLKDLETGKLDLALDVESNLPENFHSRTLYTECYACLVRHGHPLLQTLRKDGSLHPAKASAYPQIVLLYPVGSRLEGDDVLTKLGHPAKRIAMRTPYFASAPLLLADTDHVILLPSRLGQRFAASASLTLITLDADTSFDYRLIWHERTQGDIGRSWLRARIYSLFK